MIVPPRHHGFSLVEATLAIVVVGGLVVASLSALGGLGAARLVLSDRAYAQAIAAQWEATIKSAAYADPQTPAATWGLDAGESVSDASTFDDVDDFGGFAEKNPPGPDRKPAAPGDGWKVEISVDAVRIDAGSITSATGESGLKRVSISVTRSGKMLATRVFVRASSWDEVAP